MCTPTCSPESSRLAIGLIWTPSRQLGLEELGGMRWFLPVLVFAPVLHIRGKLIAALITGFLVGHLVQAGNAWALHGGGPSWLAFGRNPDRISGWWDPAVSGTILTAAASLALPLLLFGRGWQRVLGGAGTACAIVGVLASGARGGWIGVAAVIAIGVIGAGLVRCTNRCSKNKKLPWKAAGIATAVAAVVLGVALFAAGSLIAGPLIAGRATEAYDEITQAIEQGEFNSSTGARIGMKIAAAHAWLDRPITGVGTGGYKAWAVQHGDEHTATYVHDHAHDTLLHALASGGVILAGLLTAVWITGVWQGARLAKFAPVHAGPVLALIGLGVVSFFDTLYVSAHAAAITGAVLALCPAWQPPGCGSQQPDPAAS